MEEGRLEFISWNDASRQFDFGIIEYSESLEIEDIRIIDREACTSCHYNEAPIFQRRPWSGTEADFGIMAAFIWERAEREAVAGEWTDTWEMFKAELNSGTFHCMLHTDPQTSQIEWNGIKLFRGSFPGSSGEIDKYEILDFEATVIRANRLASTNRDFPEHDAATRRTLMQTALVSWVHDDVVQSSERSTHRQAWNIFFVNNISQDTGIIADNDPRQGPDHTYAETTLIDISGPEGSFENAISFNEFEYVDDRRTAGTNQYNHGDHAIPAIPMPIANHSVAPTTGITAELASAPLAFFVGDGDVEFLRSKAEAILATLTEDRHFLRHSKSFPADAAQLAAEARVLLAKGLLMSSPVRALLDAEQFPTRDTLMSALVRGLDEVKTVWPDDQSVPDTLEGDYLSPFAGCVVPAYVPVIPQGHCARCHVGEEALLQGNLNVSFDIGSVAAWNTAFDVEASTLEEIAEAEQWLLGRRAVKSLRDDGINVGEDGRAGPRSGVLTELCFEDMPAEGSPEAEAITAQERQDLIDALVTRCHDTITEARCRALFEECYEDECSAGTPTCSGEGPGGGACDGACGGYDDVQDCWCDDECIEHGDCCDGYLADCGATCALETPPMCAMDCCGDPADPCGWNGDGICDEACAWGPDVDCI